MAEGRGRRKRVQEEKEEEEAEDTKDEAAGDILQAAIDYTSAFDLAAEM